MSSAPLVVEYGVEGEEGSCLKNMMRRLIDVEEVKFQLLISIPMIITNMAYYGITLVSVMFAGHLGDLELAGSTLGNSWGMVTGLALMIHSPYPAVFHAALVLNRGKAIPSHVTSHLDCLRTNQIS